MSYVRTSKYNKDQHTTQYKFGQIGVVALVYSEEERRGVGRQHTSDELSNHVVYRILYMVDTKFQ